MRKSTWTCCVAMAIATIAPQGWSQTVFATDENMFVEAREIRNWNMGDMTGGLLEPNPGPGPSYYKGQYFLMQENAYSSCNKTTIAAAFIHSDPALGTGQPGVFPFVKLREYLPSMADWGQGGILDFQCMNNGNEFFATLHHGKSDSQTDSQNGSFFWNSNYGLGGLGKYKFAASSGRRGWLKMESWL